MKVSFNQSTLAAFLAAIFLMVLLGYQTQRGFGRLIENNRWVEHTQIVIDSLQALLTQVEGESMSVRGYLLTGNPAFLQSFQNLREVLPQQLLNLKQLTSDNPARQTDINKLQDLLNQHWIAIQGLCQPGALRQPSVLAEQVQESNQLVDQIKVQISAMQTDERQLLQQRTAAVVQSSQLVREITTGGSICAVGIIVAATFFLNREMTARHLADEILRQNEERISLMIESIRDYAIIMLDPTGHIVSWNIGAERIKGYNSEEIIGQHFSRFYSDEQIRHRVPEMELKVATTRGRFEDEGWRVRKDGSRFWADLVITPMRDPKGQLLGFVKVTRDATSRRKADEQIQKLNEDLQQRAAQLEASNKELEAFSYSVSHDLRAPLRHIHGFVELLQKSAAIQNDKTNLHRMTIVATAAKQMGQLIDDLLAFSRTGRAQMHPVKINFREMIDQVIRDLDVETKNRQVAWDIHPLPAVTGDPSLLRLVWINLLSNALKFTRPREKAEIEIGHATSTAPGSGISEDVFFVRDNGVGFDMQYASKLFGVFQRLHRVEEFEGTGIGLANVQRIIQRHGGRVWADSKLDSGAVFSFSLPVT